MHKLLFAFLLLGFSCQSDLSSEECIKIALEDARNGEYKKALTLINTQILKDSFNTRLYSCRGEIKSQQMDFQNAILDYTRSISLKDNSGDALFFRGKAYQTLNNIDSAILDYTNALAIKKNYEGYYIDISKNKYTPPLTSASYEIKFYRGICFYEKKQDSAALIDFWAAINNKFILEEAFLYAGDIYLRKGDSSFGCNFIKSARELGNEKAEIYDKVCGN